MPIIAALIWLGVAGAQTAPPTLQRANPPITLPGFPELTAAPPKARIEGKLSPEAALIGCVRTLELRTTPAGRYLRASLGQGPSATYSLQVDQKGVVVKVADGTPFDPPVTPWTGNTTPVEVTLLSDAAASQRPVIVVTEAAMGDIRPARLLGVDYLYSDCDN
jgi:hypothetical protein